MVAAIGITRLELDAFFPAQAERLLQLKAHADTGIADPFQPVVASLRRKIPSFLSSTFLIACGRNASSRRRRSISKTSLTTSTLPPALSKQTKQTTMPTLIVSEPSKSDDVFKPEGTTFLLLRAAIAARRLMAICPHSPRTPWKAERLENPTSKAVSVIDKRYLHNFSVTRFMRNSRMNSRQDRPSSDCISRRRIPYSWRVVIAELNR